MIAIGHSEAILFRILVAFFGHDRVVPQMSLAAVCGGGLPEALHQSVSDGIVSDFNQSPEDWARTSKCLFTIVNEADHPCLVVEYVDEYPEAIDPEQLSRHRFLRPILRAAGIPFVTMSSAELSDVTNPGSGVDFCALLKAKFECSVEEGS